MFAILLTANFKFRNSSTCSKGSMKRTGKVCGYSQDLKSSGVIGCGKDQLTFDLFAYEKEEEGEGEGGGVGVMWPELSNSWLPFKNHKL